MLLTQDQNNALVKTESQLKKTMLIEHVTVLEEFTNGLIIKREAQILDLTSKQ